MKPSIVPASGGALLCCKHSGASYHPQRSKYKCNAGVVAVEFNPVLLFPASTVDSVDDCAVPPTRLTRPCVGTLLLQVCALRGSSYERPCETAQGALSSGSWMQW